MKAEYRILLLISAVLTLLSVLSGTQLTGTELLIRPSWAKSLGGEDEGTLSNPSATPLRLPKHLLYTDNLGRTSLTAYTSYVSFNDKHFITYDEDTSEALVLREPSGNLVFTFPDQGKFPVLRESGLGLLDAEGMNLSWYDNEGIQLWKYSSLFPLIGLEESKDGSTALLSLDGGLVVLDQSGKETSRRQPRDGSIPLGLALALGNNSTIALVEGLEPQYITVLDYSGAALKQRWSRQSGTSFTNDVYLRFIDAGNLVFMEMDHGFALYKAIDGKVLSRPLEGRIRKIIDYPPAKLFILIRDSEAGAFIDFWAYDGRIRSSSGPYLSLYDCAISGEDLALFADSEGLVALRLELVP